MARFTDRKQRRSWKKIRIRKRMSGTAERPRVCVFKSGKFVYAQAVDDIAGATLAAASSQEPSFRGQLKTSGKHLSVAEQVGKLISERLQAKGIKQFVFDRGGYLYHGRVRAVCNGLNEGLGLKVPEKAPETVPEKAPKKVSEKAPKKAPEKAPEKTGE
jgi:large subunit ribosomal protein L18